MTHDLGFYDFDSIQRLLESLTSTPYGQEAARVLEPPESIEVARQMQRSVTVARQMADISQLPELDDVPNIRAALRQAGAAGASLNARALANILQVLATGARLVEVLQTWPPLYPQSIDHLTPDDELASAISRIVTPEGQLRRDASGKLAQLWEDIDAHREQATELLRALLKKKEIKYSVKERDAVTWQGDRAVLRVRADVADRVQGVRRGHQQGGQDELIEPVEVVAVNNRIEKLAGQIRAEQQLVLRDASAVVHRFLQPLESLLDCLTWIDLALAGGRLSHQFSGHAPKLTEAPGLHLNEAYHPLLLMQFMQGTLERPVPISLKLDDQHAFLLVTGPNTGGKTVILKTVGMLVSMASCGLHIPAEQDCTIGWYEHVMVDMGDRQSLYHQLSTFAGHVEMMKRILAQANERTLLLLDELGTGTDPDEGAALAMSLIHSLAERGCQGVLNTHLSPLKTFAEQHDKVVNAAMAFDEKTLSPTYRLQTGACGISYGLAVAEKNGLEADVIALAKDYLGMIQRDKP